MSHRHANPKDRILVTMNSRKRHSGTNTNLHMRLNEPIDRVHKIEFVSAEIPLSYYTINDGNNTLHGSFNGASSLTITPGTYTRAGIANEIDTRLTAEGIDATVTFEAHRLNIETDISITINTGSAAATLGFSSSQSGTVLSSNFDIYASEFTFKEQNRTLTVDNGIAYTITIPEGNYSGSGLASTVEDEINGTALSGYSVEFIGSRLRYKISAGESFTISGNLANFMGIDDNTSSVNSEIVSQNIVNLSGPAYIYIKSNTISEKRYTRVYASSDYKDIAHKISLLAAPGNTNVTETNYQNQVVFSNPRGITIRDFDLRLVDEDNYLMELNGLEWSLSLIFVTY